MVLIDFYRTFNKRYFDVKEYLRESRMLLILTLPFFTNKLSFKKFNFKMSKDNNSKLNINKYLQIRK